MFPVGHVNTDYGYSGVAADPGTVQVTFEGCGSSAWEASTASHSACSSVSRGSGILDNHCTSEAWAGPCQRCFEERGAENCTTAVMWDHGERWVRDDLTEFAFAARDAEWPIRIRVSGMNGTDFAPETLCQADGAFANGGGRNISTQGLFIALTPMSAFEDPRPSHGSALFATCLWVSLVLCICGIFGALGHKVYTYLAKARQGLQYEQLSAVDDTLVSDHQTQAWPPPE